MNRAFKETNINGSTRLVRQKKDIDKIDALIIPGGESTTISKILVTSGMHDVIIQRIKKDDFPIMGTCAGCMLLAKGIVGNEEEIKLLHAMGMEVEKNAFGRQKESFEKTIEIKGFSEPYNAVFIRAPVIRRVWDKCEVLAKIDEKIIAARQGRFLAFSFHPELTDDLRIHRYFFEVII